MSFDKNSVLLYAITDRAWASKTTLFNQIECALKGGVTCVQLREKEISESEFIEEAMLIKPLCEKYGVPLIINDNLSVALKSGADGVHLGKDDLALEQARSLAGNDFIIGATAKTVEQAINAQNAGANYLGVGSVFASPTKKDAIRITKELLKEICTSVIIPVVAIGGIEKDNIKELAGCNIDGIATVSAVFSAKDIESECKILKQIVKSTISE